MPRKSKPKDVHKLEPISEVQFEEHELKICIGNKDGRTIVQFDRPVVWVAFDAESAWNFSVLLLEHVGIDVRKGNGSDHTIQTDVDRKSSALRQ
jgi:hypothetical protein